MPTQKMLRGATSPKIKAPVTREIIDAAVPRDSGHCMVAEAIKAARPYARFVAVDLQTIRFSEGDRRYIYLTPRPTQQALVDFDQGKLPEPFVINLRNAHVMLAGRQGRYGTRSELRQNNDGGGTIPVRVGGQAPPVGPLSNAGKSRGNKTGMRREFGLRAILR